MADNNDRNVCDVVADIPMMENSANFWLAFLCGVLVVALLVGPMTTRVNLLACAVVGSYAAVVPIDHYIGANLKYIFINIMRRATVPDFNQAVIDPPFQTKGNVCVFHLLSLKFLGYTWIQLDESNVYYDMIQDPGTLLSPVKKLVKMEFEF